MLHRDPPVHGGMSSTIPWGLSPPGTSSAGCALSAYDSQTLPDVPKGKCGSWLRTCRLDPRTLFLVSKSLWNESRLWTLMLGDPGPVRSPHQVSAVPSVEGARRCPPISVCLHSANVIPPLPQPWYPF